MRSATIIMGAVAIAVCLVAAALVIANTRSSSPALGAPRRSDASATPRRAAAPAPTIPAPTSASTLRSCGAGFSVEGPGASCAFGQRVVRAFRANGESGRFYAYDPATKTNYATTCSGTAPTACKAENGVTVYFGQ